MAGDRQIKFMLKMYSQSVEDYLEAIYNIITNKGYTRTKDIAKELNVTPPSVSAMLKKLQDNGLIFVYSQ